MTRLLMRPAHLLALTLCLCPSPGLRASEPEPSAGPVVLELFTSQACSSCPPAETLLARLGLDARTRAAVVPLAFHVDYWDETGWVDREARPEWTQRQRDYCRALRVDQGPYTPQLVVAGQAQVNGSDALGIAREIEAARGRPALARLALSARRVEGRPGVEASLDAAVLRPGLPRRLEVLLAVFEGGLATPVARGENKGRTLRGEFVVRRLTRLATLSPAPGARWHGVTTVSLDPRWTSERVGLAAFLQDRQTMAIHASASLPALPSAP